MKSEEQGPLVGPQPLPSWASEDKSKPLFLCDSAEDAKRIESAGLTAISMDSFYNVSSNDLGKTWLSGRWLIDVWSPEGPPSDISEREGSPPLRWQNVLSPGDGDIHEWLKLHGISDHTSAPVETNGIQTIMQLMSKTFQDAKWVVPDIIPEGLTLLGAKAKFGKTWFGLALALAVAFGGMALGNVKVEPGSVLYLILEDGEVQAQERLRQLLGDDSPPDNFYYAIEWPQVDEGGIQKLEDWIISHPDARLIVIDTLKRVRPHTNGRRNMYDTDYESLKGLADLSHKYAIGILVFHHLKKAPVADDPFDELSGSTGLQAVPDTLAILRGVRGNREAELYIAGRRTRQDSALSLSFDLNSGLWTLNGNAEVHKISVARQDILDLLREADRPLSTTEVAFTLDKNRKTTYNTLTSMQEAGQVEHPTEKTWTVEKEGADLSKQSSLPGLDSQYGEHSLRSPDHVVAPASNSETTTMEPDIVRAFPGEYADSDRPDYADYGDYDTAEIDFGVEDASGAPSSDDDGFIAEVEAKLRTFAS
jgi:AAA domain